MYESQPSYDNSSFLKESRGAALQVPGSRSQKKTVRTITIPDGLFSIASRDFRSNRRKSRQMVRLGPSTANTDSRQINDLDKQRHGETMERE
jgi:hypothetical protein